jgi:hypothetical protein
MAPANLPIRNRALLVEERKRAAGSVHSGAEARTARSGSTYGKEAWAVVSNASSTGRPINPGG